MSTSTLTSLAMLKVQVDQGHDYLDYLRPFVLQVLLDHRPDPVTDIAVCNFIDKDFGLVIPPRAVQVVLKRLSKHHSLRKEKGSYKITGPLPDPRITEIKSDADRHIRAVVTGLIDFSNTTSKPIADSSAAINAICGFLSEFNIPCLRAYLRGTAIPSVEHDDAHIVLVSQYILKLQDSDPERFNSFLIVVTGHMLANGILCPDLQSAPKTYKDVTFYFDTPILVRQLGLEGDAKKLAIDSLITLLYSLGASAATFSHSRDELERVIRGAADYVESPAGRGAIVMEARRIRTSRSDLLLLAGRVSSRLSEARINVIPTPRYIADFQIDESAFEKALDDEVAYHNPRAKEYDINSVRSIYVLRAHTSPPSLERSKAVLVTSNTGFAYAAYEYGRRHEESREVSSVITDFSLANVSWLKAPLGAPTLPLMEVVAFSYAALQPSKKLLDKYLNEIDKLEKMGTISERDLQLLRSSELAQKELMALTLGEEDALTEQTITDTLSRVLHEITKEEQDKLDREKTEHKNTQQMLASIQAEKANLQTNLYWRCCRRASICTWCVTILIITLLVVGVLVGIGLTTKYRAVGWIFASSTAMLILLTLGNLLIGTTVKRIHYMIYNFCLTWFLKQQFLGTDINIEDILRPHLP